ncbi:Filamentous hemagglutinin [Frankliniella fusca]|uniref:Filamentous hemagglutinin n=1 Tax=Frankliniella fusca TaxID=407009 RepID=A0AAE1GPM6_9NEOP|nr:Filamentous hemagglutinin [Frankliniella fusca]
MREKIESCGKGKSKSRKRCVPYDAANSSEERRVKRRSKEAELLEPQDNSCRRVTRSSRSRAGPPQSPQGPQACSGEEPQQEQAKSPRLQQDTPCVKSPPRQGLQGGPQASRSPSRLQDVPVKSPPRQGIQGGPQASKSPRLQDLQVKSPPRQGLQGGPQASESPRLQDLQVKSPPRQGLQGGPQASKSPRLQDLQVKSPSRQGLQGGPQASKSPRLQDLQVKSPSRQGLQGGPQASESPRLQDLQVKSPPRQVMGEPEAFKSPRLQDVCVRPPPQQAKGEPQASKSPPRLLDLQVKLPPPEDEGKPQSVQTASPSSTPLKEPRETQEHLCTPGQAKVLNESVDCAPSPVTPWLPKQAPALVKSLARLEENDSVPSPQGMSLPQLPPSSCRLVEEETTTIKEEPRLTVAVDDIQSTADHRGLSLDGLIDEILVKNSSSPESSISMDISSFDLSLNSTKHSGTDIGSQELVQEPSIWSQTTVTDEPNLNSVPMVSSPPHGNHPRASCPDATEEGIILNSEKAFCAHTVSDGLQQASPVGAQMEQPNSAFSQENEKIPQTYADSNPLLEMSSAQSVSTILMNTNFEEDADSKTLPSKSPVADLCTDEHFSEELILSESQFLFIDEKCTFLGDELLAPSPHSLPAHDSTTQQEPKPTSSPETPSTSRSLPNLGFTVPPAPCMDWVQKTLQSRQRLRTMIQEISRLNAMVLRARRTIWPRQQQQPNISQTNNHMPGANMQTVPQRHTPQIPDLSKEPEWNIS